MIVGVALADGSGVLVGAGVLVAVAVLVGAAGGRGVLVGVGVLVTVGVGVIVGVEVLVGVLVGVFVGVAVGVLVAGFCNGVALVVENAPLPALFTARSRKLWTVPKFALWAVKMNWIVAASELVISAQDA